ncbi:MAG: DNA primase [Anaerolineae bacterium]|nr:DNA primase [Anaerolineae bacterium]
MSIADEIKSKFDIVDFVSNTVSLKKTGKNYTGFCPFHQNTKTPSFVVFPDTQTWRCFGACADGGDIFSFVMKQEGYDFKEALQALAQQAGISLTAVGSNDDEQDKHRQKLLELTAAAAAYYHHLLTNSPAGALARDYLTQRDFTAETIATFQLGFALNEWDGLKNHFIARGYSPDELLAAGLIVERDDGSPGYDRFRDRLMIPIRDPRGRVIGFGARALQVDQVPKYLNSPQTVLFDKSNTLYGLDLARKHIRDADQAVVVEGYMDVIQAYQRGARNVVAQMGTALTEQQLKILKRTTGNFVLALDADTAGNAATLRGLNLARETLERENVPVPTAWGLIRYEERLNADIRIASLPPGRDPDDILREGLEAWQKIIDGALPVVDFYFQAVTADLDLSSAKGKSIAVQKLIPVLRDLGNNVEQEHYVQKLARLIHIDERTLMAELRSNRKPDKKRRQQPQPSTPDLSKIQEKVVAKPALQPARSSLEAYCLSLILAHPFALAMSNDVLEQQQVKALGTHDFRRGDYKEIFKSLQLWTAAETPRIETLSDMVGETLEGQLATLASLWHRQPPTPAETAFRDLSIAILRLRLQNIIQEIEELQFLLREAEDNKQPEEARRYREMIAACSEQKHQLHNVSDALSLTGKRRAEAKASM